MKHGFIKAAAASAQMKAGSPRFNTENITALMREAGEQGVKILLLPELCITGYTCGDLFLQKALLDGAETALAEIVECSAGLDMLIFAGLPVKAWGGVYNAAAAVYDGELLGIIPKCGIPANSDMGEGRVFTAFDSARGVEEITVCGEQVPFGSKILFSHQRLPELMVGVEIGHDAYLPIPPSAGHVYAGASVIVNPAAFGGTVTGERERAGIIKAQSARLVCGYMVSEAGYGESTGDAVFLGQKLICENGAILDTGTYARDMIISELDVQKLDHQRRRTGGFTAASDGEYVYIPWGKKIEETVLSRKVSKTPFVPESDAETEARCGKIIEMQALSLKKRVEHTGAKRLLIGVSGGLDSTLAMLVSARALDMLGRPRGDILAVTMPCFGTTARTKSNAESLALGLGAELKEVDITKSVLMHFEDIGHSPEDHSVVFENAQARERTQVLMDIANGCGGLVVGTGDLSESALGWATYNGDHMSMYDVNSGVPKTLLRRLVGYAAKTWGDAALAKTLLSIVDTPVSPELLPAEDGEISQRTEDIVGPYELHDFFLYYMVRWGFPPGKIYRLAKYAFNGGYENGAILKWLKVFCRRFFSQQFKRSCAPDGPKIGSVSLSPRGGLQMPSDASAEVWLEELENLKA